MNHAGSDACIYCLKRPRVGRRPSATHVQNANGIRPSQRQVECIQITWRQLTAVGRSHRELRPNRFDWPRRGTHSFDERFSLAARSTIEWSCEDSLHKQKETRASRLWRCDTCNIRSHHFERTRVINTAFDVRGFRVVVETPSCSLQ